MKYRIEYENGRCCSFVTGREQLIKYLRESENETIKDIRKVYKNGITDSVYDIYWKFIGEGRIWK